MKYRIPLLRLCLSIIKVSKQQQQILILRFDFQKNFSLF